MHGMFAFALSMLVHLVGEDSAGGKGGEGGGVYIMCWLRVQKQTISGLVMQDQAQAPTQIQVTESACVITTLVT